MHVISGKVVDGKIVVEGVTLDEGTIVTVLAPTGDDARELTPEEEAFLIEALREADRGEGIDGPALLRDLAAKT